MRWRLYILFALCWLWLCVTAYAIRINIGPSMEHRINIGPSQGGAAPAPPANGPVGWF